MTAPTSSSLITVREATPGDLADVATLLSARDEQQRTVEKVGAYLWQLDPDCTRTWLAYAGERPVGITMLYLRDMNWPMVDDANEIMRAGYWAHLFVQPEFRKQMVYPQLVLAMLRAMKPAGIDLIYTGTRQALVAEGHQKLGFALVDKLPVCLRPLRPFRLLAKHKGADVVAPLVAPLDTVYQLCAGLSGHLNATIETIDLDSSDINAIVDLLNSLSSDYVRQLWTPQLLRNRFCATLDGHPYRVTGVRRDGQLVGALVATIATRGNKIRAGVILELATAADATASEVQSLLAEAEAYAVEQGAELILTMPSSLMDPRLGKLGDKYLMTRSEEYHVLVYPKTLATSDTPAGSLENWRFTFGDHDAF